MRCTHEALEMTYTKQCLVLQQITGAHQLLRINLKPDGFETTSHARKKVNWSDREAGITEREAVSPRQDKRAVILIKHRLARRDDRDG